ncbi:uncharacterized protein KD926_008161 [Aspergillus affinis]|uniref:uncharacterized protein n=1 Tax=Aspergillus affinis TaxID=1070780 RepID=UPI0022FE8C8F|nr:uncharacterized protein KD926_008161 [Aspergillus affinis]KAI9040594.1 hypothetical protein KD926_008161 [Aspergillus affinis]
MSTPATNNKTNNVALVFGASGISGWAVAKNLLSYLDSTNFAGESGAANSNATAYKENVMDIKAINVRMTYNAVHAVDKLCSGLKFFVLRTGTNELKFPFPAPSEIIPTHPPTPPRALSKAKIYLSVVTPESANKQAFNVAGTSDPGSWSRKWPILAEYFGLKGTAPQEDAWSELEIWWTGHQTDYLAMCHEYGLCARRIPPECWALVKAGFTLLDRNREMSLDKIRGVGFTEKLAVGEGHCVVFDRLKETRFIPAFSSFI